MKLRPSTSTPAGLWLIGLSCLLVGCTAVHPTNTAVPAPTATAAPTSSPAPAAPALPPPATSGQQLTFLQHGDIWLLELPAGKPVQLTHVGDLIGYAWSPDGNWLAGFNGREICFFDSDGGPAGHCTGLGIDRAATPQEASLIWSPDQMGLAVWGFDGWYLLALDQPITVQHITDPHAWGLPAESGRGLVGQPLFLPNGALIGTVADLDQCGASGNCRYSLHQFDLQAQRFVTEPLPIEIGDGAQLGLSADGKALAIMGTFCAGAAACSTHFSLFFLDTGTTISRTLNSETFFEHALSPDASWALLAPHGEPGDDWAIRCGLAELFPVAAMALLDFETGQRMELVPGRSPAWAPDSGRIAFRSCLVQQADGGWQPTPAGPPQIYLLEQANQRILITPVAEGSAPAWRPISAGPTHLSGAANRPFTPKGQQAPLLAVGMNGPYA